MRRAQEILAISSTPDGHKVYSATDPRRTYLVRRTGGRFVCSCPDFQKHADDPDWRCKHVLAVEHESSPAQMYVKRSVLPDGRIDSLSVGVSWSIDGVAARDLRTRIEKTLKLQADVVSRFLAETKTAKETRGADEVVQPPEDTSSQAAPAWMVEVGGMDGRWGRRLFIAVESGGRTLRLFGTERRLAQAITDAGFLKIAAQVAEGVRLDLPCRVVTRPTPDGRYLNIEQVLPAEAERTRR